jgi:serine/threonine-protein kinase
MNARRHGDATDWPRLSARLDEALALPIELRDRWLERLPPAELPLLPALRDMLARAADESDEFMHRPARLRAADDPEAVDDGMAHAGLLVGPYRLLREIGAGGMGAVWLAERADGMLKRKVAIKLPRLSWDTSGLADRMTREREILAGLEHPNIARLYDAGLDNHGRPYLAMEYVEGRALDVHCNEGGLGVRERLELFLQVARAVAYAHARLIVHRDLKPTNILVTPDGSARLLDFGIAKLIEGDAGRESANETRLTLLGGRALTPDYAAPEQIRGEAITVAVDVYSLGVVLYELLTGRRPYKLASNPSITLEDALAKLEILPASTMVADSQLARRLRGDLDTILDKALRPAPTERYPTVEALTADLQRYLDGAPVLARPDTIGHRVARFVRRNKAPVGVVILIILALLGGAIPMAAVMIALALGTGVALWQAGMARREARRAADEARQAQRERDRAEVLSERHGAAVDFIQIMLTEAAQTEETITLGELLSRSEALALASSGGQPDHQVAVLDLLASFYTSFGNIAKAESLLAKAIDRLPPSADASLRAQIECNHALVISELGRVEIAKQTIDGWLARSDVDPHVAALCQQYLAEIARNHNDAKGALFNALGAQERLRASRRKLPAFEASLAGDVAYAYFLNGRSDEADRQYAAAMQAHRDIGREESPVAVAILNNWGLACTGTGDEKRGLAMFEEVLRIVTKRSANALPPPYAVHNLASLLLSLGRYDEAMREAERAGQLADRAGVGLFRLGARVIQAAVHRERGELDASERVLLEVAPSVPEFPADSFAVISFKTASAMLALRRGRFDEARATVEPVIQLFEGRGMQTATLTKALRLRSEILWHQGHVEAALGDARRALANAQQLQGANAHSSVTGLGWLLLARLLDETHDRAGADAAAQHAIDHLDAMLGEDHPETRRASSLKAAPVQGPPPLSPA